MSKIIYFFYIDTSGNPVTETVQSILVTDSSGNPVTGNINFEWL